MNPSHSIVTACMIGLGVIVVLSQDWVKAAHDWFVQQINTKATPVAGLSAAAPTGAITGTDAAAQNQGLAGLAGKQIGYYGAAIANGISPQDARTQALQVTP